MAFEAVHGIKNNKCFGSVPICLHKETFDLETIEAGDYGSFDYLDTIWDLPESMTPVIIATIACTDSTAIANLAITYQFTPKTGDTTKYKGFSGRVTNTSENDVSNVKVNVVVLAYD